MTCPIYVSTTRVRMRLLKTGPRPFRVQTVSSISIATKIGAATEQPQGRGTARRANLAKGPILLRAKMGGWLGNYSRSWKETMGREAANDESESG